MGSALRAHHGLIIRKVPIGLLGGIEYDLYYPEVSSLIYFNGADTSTSFIEEKNKTWTAVDNAQIDTAQYKYGVSSGLFDGSGDYISTASHADFNFGTGDFTVETWVRFASHTTVMTLVSNYIGVATGWSLQRRSDSNTIRFAYGDTALLDVSWTPTDNVWYHLAVTRSGTSLRAFIDGTQVGSTATNSTNIATGTNLEVGRIATAGTQYFNGWLDNLRITKGVARYFETFTPPTHAQMINSNGWDDNFTSVSALLHGEGINGSTAIEDVTGKAWTAFGNAQISTAQKKFGDSSFAFDGVGDYFSTPHHVDLSLISGDWTIEGWLRLSATPGSSFSILNKDGVSGSAYPQYDVNVSSAMKLCAFLGNGVDTSPTGTSYTGTTTLVTGTWYHFAVVKSGANTLGYLNGVEQWNATAAAMYEGSKPLLIGYQQDVSGSNFNGNIEEIRITKGVARYTTNFTPPLAPFPNSITADDKMYLVSSLLHGEGADASTTFTDLTGKVWTASGNAQIDTAQFKYGTASMLFDGTGDYIDATSNPDFAMGTGDFTWEAWVRADSATAAWSRLYENETFDVTGGYHLSFNGSDGAGVRRLGYQVGNTGGGGARIDTNTAFPVNTWTHIALCRVSAVTSMYVNGIKQTATLADTNNYTSQKSRIGATLGTPGNYYTGHIDDMRITKGFARYTANFVPPIKAHCDIGYYAPFGSFTSSLLQFNGADASTTFTDEKGLTWTANGNAQIDTAQSKFGGASGLFDGTGDYISTPSTANFAFETGDYTIEAWVRTSTIAAGYASIFFLNTSIALYRKGSTFIWYEGADRCVSSTIAIDTWYHVAVTRKAGIIYLYVNGVLSATTYTSSLNVGNGVGYIGANSAGGEGFTGWIDSLRVTKGFARYGGNFAVPTTPPRLY